MFEQTNYVILIRITRSFVSFAVFRNFRDRCLHRTPKLWPYKYVLHFWNSYTIPKHSVSTTEYLLCVGESFLLAKATGNNVMFPSWSNISPSPVSDAFVRKIKCFFMYYVWVCYIGSALVG